MLKSIAAIIVLIFTTTVNEVKAQKLDFELLYKIDLTLEKGLELGETPLGKRIIYSITGGKFSGPQVKGIVKPIGGDWVLRIDSLTTKLDVKLILETDDGALISSSYNGIVRTNKDGTAYWRIAPIFETSSKKYDWINYILAIGIGKFNDTGISYEVYKIK